MSNNSTSIGLGWRSQRFPEWRTFNVEMENAGLFNYAFAVVFLIIACTSMVAVSGLHPQVALKRHIIALNAFIFIMAAVRSVCLFVDPYGSRQVIINVPSPLPRTSLRRALFPLFQLLPPLATDLLQELPLPCLLAAFAILHVTFNQFTALRSSTWIGELAAGAVLMHLVLVFASALQWHIPHFRVSVLSLSCRCVHKLILYC